MLTRLFENLKLKNTISSLLGVKLKKYLRLIFLQLDHQTLSACLKNRVEKKLGKKAYCVGLELNYFTVKGWAQVNITYPDVYIIESMAVVTYQSTSKFLIFLLYCTRYDNRKASRT